MTILIILFGTLILFIGIIITIQPKVIVGFVRKRLGNLQLHIFAVVIRIVIGFLLITQSDVSRFPFIIEVIGWLSLIAAFTLAAIGRQSFHRLMTWAVSMAKHYGRIGGILAGAFGAFLIYAFI